MITLEATTNVVTGKLYPTPMVSPAFVTEAYVTPAAYRPNNNNAWIRTCASPTGFVIDELQSTNPYDSLGTRTKTFAYPGGLSIVTVWISAHVVYRCSPSSPRGAGSA